MKPIRSFADAGLHPVMLRNIELCGYKVPTPIQKYCIPGIGMGYDVIAIAQTGEYLLKPAFSCLRHAEFTIIRFRQNRCLPDSDSEQVDGKGQEACRPSPESGDVRCQV